jgi:NADPH-dependent 2,4-dienoyl-CoA reductase/sulfur reductase-like enzyme
VAEALRADVAVVGAGPAGVAAACRAAEAGARVVLLDENLAPGGQIHRHLPGEAPPPKSRPWLDRLWKSGAEVVTATSLFDAERRGDAWYLRALEGKRVLFVRARRLVVATGARELFLPFPGWTLPGVLGAGAAQALVKSGADLSGKRAVVAGTGPLLLSAAAALEKAGADVVFVAEQAPFSKLAGFAATLVRTPGRILEGMRYRGAIAGAPYRTGFWVKAAGGAGRVERAHVTNRMRKLEVACDLLCVGWGLVPNLELPKLIGCQIDSRGVVVTPRQETSASGVFAAGEVCGIAGAETAVWEGEIAGLAASDSLATDGAEERRLFAGRARGRRFGAALADAFALRPEVLALAMPETLVCRCEDVPLARLSGARSMREAKLETRAGMGACQGRICGSALSRILGLSPDTVRPPLVPVPMEALASEEEPT